MQLRSALPLSKWYRLPCIWKYIHTYTLKLLNILPKRRAPLKFDNMLFDHYILTLSFRMKKASEAALQYAENQDLKFYPEYHSNLWRHWLQSNRYELNFFVNAHILNFSLIGKYILRKLLHNFSKEEIFSITYMLHLSDIFVKRTSRT